MPLKGAAMTDDEGGDSDESEISLFDLEEPIVDLRDGIGALLAMNPHIAIEEAGILWIAGKLQETVEDLLEQWRTLVAQSRSGDAGDPEEG